MIKLRPPGTTVPRGKAQWRDGVYDSEVVVCGQGPCRATALPLPAHVGVRHVYFHVDSQQSLKLWRRSYLSASPWGPSLALPAQYQGHWEPAFMLYLKGTGKEASHQPSCPFHPRQGPGDFQVLLSDKKAPLLGNPHITKVPEDPRQWGGLSTRPGFTLAKARAHHAMLEQASPGG